MKKLIAIAIAAITLTACSAPTTHYVAPVQSYKPAPTIGKKFTYVCENGADIEWKHFDYGQELVTVSINGQTLVFNREPSRKRFKSSSAFTLANADKTAVFGMLVFDADRNTGRVHTVIAPTQNDVVCYVTDGVRFN